MEAKGESMAAAFLETLDESSFGASVEGGGAHWFAAPPGGRNEAEADSDASVNGRLLLEARVSWGHAAVHLPIRQQGARSRACVQSIAVMSDMRPFRVCASS